MTKAERQSLAVVPLLVLLAAALAAAGSQGGATVGGVPVFAIAVTVAFAIQWLVFVPSYLARTERFFDLTGSVTYIAVTLGVLLLARGWDARRVLLAVLVLVWAVRLGTFLFGRVSRSGADDRFDEIKGSFPRFLAVWTTKACGSASQQRRRGSRSARRGRSISTSSPWSGCSSGPPASLSR